jgi:tetratricopeptide (TPR) repeat protein
MPALELLVELFERICQGIQHAHQRGLIHRDIKPSNLLVTEHAGQPLPKIIDFGVAIGGVPGQSVAVRSNSAIGTRAYMAPEQAQPGPQGIDARADVYGLGATLAALLCLRLGISADGSMALSHFQQAQRASSMSLHGQPPAAVDPDKVQRLRRGTPKALRAILLKAMATDRDQRYESAAALASDLQRWRGGYPVQALGSSSGYALRCFLARHRWASAAGIGAVFALLGGIAVALYGLGQARQAEAIAEQRRVQAEDLVGVMLGDLADKLRPLGRLDLLETVGAEAMRYLSAAAASDSTGGAVQRARALRTLGEVYVQRQQTEQAAQAFAEAERTLAQADPAVEGEAELLFEKGQAAYWVGSLAFMAQDLDTAREHFEAYLAYATQLRTRDPADLTGKKEYGYALSNLAALDFRVGQIEGGVGGFDRAIAELTDALRSTPDDQTLVQEISNVISLLGSQLEASGRPAEALVRYRRQLQLLEGLPSTDANAQYRIALALHFNARLSSLTGQPQATGQISRALDILARLVELEPSNQIWRQALMSAEVQAGEIAMVTRESESAVRHLELALAHAGQLEDQEERRVLALKFRARLRLASLASIARQPRLAERHLQAAELHGSALGDRMLSSDTGRRDLAVYTLINSRNRRPTAPSLPTPAEVMKAGDELDAPHAGIGLEYSLARTLVKETQGGTTSRDELEKIVDFGYDPLALTALLGGANSALSGDSTQ